MSTNENEKDRPARWKGDEVERRSAGEAERAAQRLEDEAGATPPSDEPRTAAPAREPGAGDGTAEEDIAENHREHHAGEGSSRGKL